jgi:hypothetical protein
MSEHETAANQVAMSVADDSLDEMIEAASVPTLADLFRMAKSRGVIDVTINNYGEGGPPQGGSSTP